MGKEQSPIDTRLNAEIDSYVELRRDFFEALTTCTFLFPRLMQSEFANKDLEFVIVDRHDEPRIVTIRGVAPYVFGVMAKALFDDLVDMGHSEDAITIGNKLVDKYKNGAGKTTG